MIAEKPEGYNSNLSNEVRHRLWQLSFIYEMLQKYDKIVINPLTAIRSPHENVRKLDEGMVFAEAFYSTAWRIICIAKHGLKPLPYLQGMKNKAKGVNDVRNHLLVHPEKHKDKILMISFSWGNEGPIFKNARSAGQTFELMDNGLWENAKEFKNDFEELLQKATAG